VRISTSVGRLMNAKSSRDVEGLADLFGGTGSMFVTFVRGTYSSTYVRKDMCVLVSMAELRN
jgi:hypothetical protein